MTMSMMARVSLGHSGRRVLHPPTGTGWVFACVAVGAAIRVLLPLAWPSEYRLWVGLAQGLWIAGFVGLILLYVPCWFFDALPHPDADPAPVT